MILAIVLASQLAMPCWVVKAAVANYGEQAAIQWAKSQGYSDKSIEDIKRACLRSH